MHLPTPKRISILIIDEDLPRAEELQTILKHHYSPEIFSETQEMICQTEAGNFPYVLVVCSLHSLSEKGIPLLTKMVANHPKDRITVALSWPMAQDDFFPDVPEIIAYPYEKMVVLQKIRMLLRKQNRDMSLESLFLLQEQKMKTGRMAYRHTQMQLKALAANLPGGIAILQIKDEIIHVQYANAGIYHLLEWEKDDGKNTLDEALQMRIPKSEYLHLYAMLKTAKPQQKLTHIFRVIRQDERIIWCELTFHLVLHKNGTPTFFAMLLDATHRTETERMLQARNQQYLLISQNSDEKLVTYDVEHDVFRYPVLHNGQVTETSIHHFFNDGLFKRDIHPDDLSVFEKVFFDVIDKKEPDSLEVRTKLFDDEYTWYRLSYAPICSPQGTVSQIVARCKNIHHDMAKLHRQQQIIDHLANKDNVTGLLNLSVFQSQIADTLKMDNPTLTYAISYSDINNFSYFNETYGYEAGNQILYGFGVAMRCLREKYFGCRTYSDFFLIFHMGVSQNHIIQDVTRLQAEFNRIIRDTFPQNDIQLSTGVCFLPDRDYDISHIIDSANLARKKAKSSQGNTIEIYTAQMRKDRLYRQMIIGEFEQAINRGEFEIFLQPKFSLRKWNIVGAEALVRWRDSSGSYRNTEEFISIFEDSGQIVHLDFYVLEQVLEVLSNWQKRHIPFLPISINLSRLHVSNPNLVEDIIALVDKYDVPHKYIELETTESAMICNTGLLMEKLRQLKEAGFLVDMDDFGTGYSSLNLLMDNVFDVVKVDRSLILHIDSEKNKNNVKYLIQLIHNAEKKIVFEGIETKEQVELLLDAGCGTGQGFIFSKPIPIAEFEKKYLQELS